MPTPRGSKKAKKRVVKSSSSKTKSKAEAAVKKSAGATGPKPTVSEIFKALEKVLALYSPPLKMWVSGTSAKPHTRLTIPTAVVISGIYSGKPIELEVASLVVGKGDVSFHFLPLYIKPALKARIPAGLRKMLKGKTCFHIKTTDAAVMEEVRVAVDAGTQLYRDKGWL